MGRHGNIISEITTPEKKYPLFHWEIILIQERRTKLIIPRLTYKQKPARRIFKCHCHIFNKYIRNHILHLLAL